MVRSKVKLEFIKDDSARRATYRKRSKGVLKKANELSTLCDIQSCAIVYGPYNPTPEVWPSIDGAREVLARFREMPEYQQCVKKENQESFTRGRIKKVEEKLLKLQVENRHNDLTRLMYKGLRGEETTKNVVDLIDIVSVAEEKIKEIALGMEKLKLAAASDKGKGKQLEGNPDPAQGEETSNGAEGGKQAQGVETMNVVIKDTRVPQQAQVTTARPMDQDKLQRIMAIAKGKSKVVENLPLAGTNMVPAVGTISIREPENGGDQMSTLHQPMPSNPVPNYELGMNTDDLMPFPYQLGFGWEDMPMAFPNTYNWSFPSNPNNPNP